MPGYIFLGFLLCIPFFLSCSYPSDSSQRDLIEIERVWQYIKAYSLYQSSVPSRAQALAFSDPYALVDNIPDTLYSHWQDTTIRIAGYYPDCWGPGGLGKTALPEKMSAGFIRLGTVCFSMLTDSTAYICIDSFIAETHLQMRQFDTSVARAKNIIIDLAGNPGGSLDACTASIELLLPSGIPYLSTTFRKAIQTTGDTGTLSETWVSRRSGDAWEGKNIAVIISSGTASAAEIMAVALRDGLGTSRMRLVGQPSYGKAIGQYTFCLWRSSGAFLILTGFRFYSVAGQGYDYHEKGIQPHDSVAGTYLDRILAAGERLEPGFTARVDTNEIKNALAKSPESLRQMIPRCYMALPDADFALF